MLLKSWNLYIDDKVKNKTIWLISYQPKPNFLRLLSSLSSPSVLALNWDDDRAPNGPSIDDDDLIVSGEDCITWGDDFIVFGDDLTDNGDDLMVGAGDCAGDEPM